MRVVNRGIKVTILPFLCISIMTVKHNSLPSINIFVFFISSFRRVLYVVCKLLGCSPAYGI
jgi:hypothetical protein